MKLCCGRKDQRCEDCEVWEDPKNPTESTPIFYPGHGSPESDEIWRRFKAAEIHFVGSIINGVWVRDFRVYKTHEEAAKAK